LLTVLILTTTYTALCHRWLTRGFDPLLSLTFIALILSASAYTLNARPHIISISLLGLVFGIIRSIEDHRTRLTQLSWLVPIFVFWSNVHGGVLGGLGTIVLVGIGWTFMWLRSGCSPITSFRDALFVWLCVSGCALALLATPYGTGSLLAWRAIMAMSLPELIVEHAPLQIGTPQGALVILLFIVYVAAFVATRRAWTLGSFWLPLVWFVLACTRIRHAPLFAIVAGIALADLLPQSRLAPWLIEHRWLRASASPRRSMARRDFVYLTVSLTLIIGAVTWIAHMASVHRHGIGWGQPTARVWPAGLVEPLNSFVEAQPDGTRIFNEPILGGFLIYNYPDLRVFVDGRCELYGESFLKDIVQAWRTPKQVGQWQEEFGFRAALIEANSPLRLYFDKSDRWRLVASAPSALFYRMDEP
jgi:hypothetical protein